MKPNVGKFIFALGWLWLLLPMPGVWAQALPLEDLGPATNFSSVMYFEPPNEQQMKMRLSGTEASPLPGALFDLKNMKVEKFSAAGKLEATMLAPQCIYAPQDGMVNSAGHVELKSGDGNFRVEGDGFMWRQDDLSLVISNHVRTVIKTHGGLLTIL